jgi:hypothetical protein
MSSAAPTTNWMEGYVTAYSGTSLTINVDTVGGSGTIASWNINVTGLQGASGPTGTTGPQGASGATGAGFQATSSTSVPISTGSVTLQTQAGLAYAVGARVRASSRSNPNSWMEGVVTAYSGTALTFNVDLTSAMVTALLAAVPPNYLAGLELVNDSSSPQTVLDITQGSATSDDNTIVILLGASGFKKNLNAAWAVGSGNGALDAGSSLAASTWYHAFLIQWTDTNVVDVLISTSLSPAMPTSYTKKRRIGSIWTDSSAHIVPFVQVGDQVLWQLVKTELSNGALASSFAAITLASVPPGVKVEALINFQWGTSNAWGQTAALQSPDQTTLFGYMGAWAGPGLWTAGQYRIRTNTSQQILGAAAGGASSGAYIYVLGYNDARGK